MIKFSKVSKVFLVVGLCAVFVIPSMAAASEGESKASIEFIPRTGVTPPVDPTNPTDPLDPTDPENPTDPGTGIEGPLSLDYVSSLYFGQQEVTTQATTYESVSKKPFIQVTDGRGTGAGWRVTAKASSFTSNGGDSLRGAVITFNNGEMVASGEQVAAPTPEASVTLATGGVDTKVVVARENTGLGTWVERWFPSEVTAAKNNNVTLSIPAETARVGTHEATITWTLSDAPGV